MRLGWRTAAGGTALEIEGNGRTINALDVGLNFSPSVEAGRRGRTGAETRVTAARPRAQPPHAGESVGRGPAGSDQPRAAGAPPPRAPRDTSRWSRFPGDSPTAAKKSLPRPQGRCARRCRCVLSDRRAAGETRGPSGRTGCVRARAGSGTRSEERRVGKEG